MTPTDTSNIEAAAEDPVNHEYVHEYEDYKPSRFRFKRHPRHHHHREADVDEGHRPKRRRHRHAREAKPVREENTTPQGQATHNHGLDNEAAFRETLFDAMADDEGAAYWEGVYGQPIHHYAKTKPANPDDPDAGLEEMSDEEYTAHVRARMWEKTHQHVLEERRLRDEATRRRKEARQRTQQMESEKEAFDRQMEESLRKGARRRKDKELRDAWTEYARTWVDLKASSKGRSGDEEVSTIRIPWPTRSGKAEDVERDEVETFFRRNPATSDDSGGGGLRSQLKIERVRWHPDRMSNLLKGSIDTSNLKRVTAVFQIVDAMYNSVH